jgi:hypothetical protein
MSMNPGLTSRFPESVIFKHLEPEVCLELLLKVLADLQKKLQKKKEAQLDISVITLPSQQLYQQLLERFRNLSALESWGNARDVKSLAKNMFQALISTAVPPITTLVLTEIIIANAMEKMMNERSQRNIAVGTDRFHSRLPSRPMPPPQQQKPSTARAPILTTEAALPPSVAPLSATIKLEKQGDNAKETPKKVEPKKEMEDPIVSIFKAKRDPGVSYAVWEQLDRDKYAVVAKEQEFRRLQEEKRLEEERIKELARAEKQAADNEERRIREQERVQAELERRRMEEELVAIERERERERKAQERLRTLGVCPAGYQWIKQLGGYRCGGGTHVVSDAQIEAFCT